MGWQSLWCPARLTTWTSASHASLSCRRRFPGCARYSARYSERILSSCVRPSSRMNLFVTCGRSTRETRFKKSRSIFSACATASPTTDNSRCCSRTWWPYPSGSTTRFWNLSTSADGKIFSNFQHLSISVLFVCFVIRIFQFRSLKLKFDWNNITFGLLD